MDFWKMELKKSDIYHMAQLAVLHEDSINSESKLAILRELIEAESLALFNENRGVAE